MSLESIINKVTNAEYNLTLKKFKKLPLEVQENTAVVEHLIDCCFKGWSKKQRVKFFTKYSMLLRYAPITLQKQYHTNNNFKYLSNYVQNFYIKEDETLVMYASLEVQKEFLYGNPDKYFLFNYATQKKIALNDLELLKNTSEEVQTDIIKQNMDYLKFAHLNVQEKFVKQNPNNFKYSNLFYQSEVADISTWNVEKLKEQVLKEYLLKSHIYNKEIFDKLCEKIINSKKSRKLLITLVKYSNPDFATPDMLDKFMEMHPKKNKYKRLKNGKLWQSILNDFNSQKTNNQNIDTNNIEEISNDKNKSIGE